MQQQLSLFGEILDVRDLISRREDQWFERKSERVSKRDLAEALVGFANADGGRIVVGIHSGHIEGVDSDPRHLNDLLQAPLDITQPPVRHAHDFVACLNAQGGQVRLLVLDVEASDRIHRTTNGKCFLRVGDETRELRLDQERELAFDKHEAIFDQTPAADFDRTDLDDVALREYASRMRSSSLERLMKSRGLVTLRDDNVVTQAGVLLFGTVTPIWSFIRYLRYEGITAETGARSNQTEDIRLEGTLPALIEQARELLHSEISQVIRLMADGRFARTPALPEFAWLEAVVNAVTHRSYSLQGAGIIVRQFSDRLEVDSPGRLPGLVRVDNIQNVRFSRNPHIARVLAEMTDYVREQNEGVPRMFQEMRQSGLREPQFRVTDASVCLTLYKQPDQNQQQFSEEVRHTIANLEALLGRRSGDHLRALLQSLARNKSISTSRAATLIGVTRATARQYLALLEEQGLVRNTGKSANDPTARWLAAGPLWAILDQFPALVALLETNPS